MSETQMYDSRMNLNSLFTAAVDGYIPGMKGATLANYVEFKRFLKDDSGKIIGGVCVDRMDPEGQEFDVRAKTVVNCAGVHADEIRKMDKPEVEKRIVPSRGTHLIFKKGMLKDNHGIIIPETKDGRLIFIINYFGHPMVGTTDEFCDETHHCEPSQAEIDFIIEELRPYFGNDYDYKANLLSAWAGLRPLVKADPADVVEVDKSNYSIKDKAIEFFQNKVRWLAYKVNASKKKKSSTAAISRNHVIEVTESGLVSLMGGKWTSYRSQGEETIDRILKDNPDRFKENLKNEQG
mmetsp:Transcript_30602/g.37773  ORF Transcript_30602/g.37773 Transcript_30602/m.37773 type:complete len:293 (-) Transcript_30602:464-1342(-)|eukprot:CAMPEP_0170453296 /NCGR_PEP_ID=MMETSP0123-20130129/1921_1 /TAXON_ID=182087 /ORGANISM="Favella ehrenbergii, Strain Fehren 1" /LENGTH=292 /DNA_ID=CAMNT_0010715613 /DNA_START=795 /DNA_END=1673 /DNA_ORIENTATION=+